MAKIKESVFSKDLVGSLDFETPYFLFSPSILEQKLLEYKENFSGAEIYFAMKSNSESEVLRTIYSLGFGFEVASSYELAFLKDLNVKPSKIIYGTSVKPISHIKDFVNYGVTRFAFDSEQELEKLAQYAKGSNVYARILVDDSKSIFTMSQKFGTSSENAQKLLMAAKRKGLVPYGVSFNVGSQALNSDAWAKGILSLKSVIESLQKEGIELDVINLGGGYPQSYFADDGIPDVTEIAKETKKALAKLPYPLKVFIEPGRGVVASCMALVVSVIAKIRRKDGFWLYLDAGAYNALLEAMAYQGTTRYQIKTVNTYSDGSQTNYILTGPTGDSLDVISKNEALPSDIAIGDKLIILDAGAYSTVLSTPFNGFPKPKVRTINTATS